MLGCSAWSYENDWIAYVRTDTYRVREWSKNKRQDLREQNTDQVKRKKNLIILRTVLCVYVLNMRAKAAYRSSCLRQERGEKSCCCESVEWWATKLGPLSDGKHT